MLDQISSIFFEEANELLDNLENSLLSLEAEPENQEFIGAVFRAMHTIKGSAGMFGYTNISEFTHEMENAFDLVRNGGLPVTKDLINLTLTARDHIRTMLGTQSNPAQQAQSEKITKELHAYIAKYTNGNTTKLPTTETTSTASQPAAISTQATWYITFRPSPTILKNGTRPELLVKELVELGTATVIVFTDKLVPLSKLDPEQCYISWDVILTTDKTENDIRDVFIFLDTNSEITVEKISGSETILHKINQTLSTKKTITRQEIDTIIKEQNQTAAATEVSATTKQRTEDRPTAAEQKKIAAQGTTDNSANQTIRVQSEKLDQLIDLVGEMVTFNARLGQIAQKYKQQQLTALSELSERLIFGLRDTAMEMRMLPIGTIFSRFRRLVHDLANQLGKSIELVTEGAETELDKTVIEKLNDPLIHLIRNSADHGIEMPDVRKAAGKKTEGVITLSAKHAGGFVLITISDDGKGLDKEAIRNTAVEKGLIKPSEELSDQEIYDLIFLPGFSTNKNITSVSGRGVGMDVVRKDISFLGGTVSIETTAGKGSCFILTIPLTLAIIDGMLVRIGSQMFVIPLSNIEECVAFKSEENNTLCPHITARNIYLPCIDMHTYFNFTEPVPQNRQAVIVNDQDCKIGIVVDTIIGNHQTVIKPIGELYKNIAGISGATILGDGSVALILDILKLSQIIRKLDQKEK